MFNSRKNHAYQTIYSADSSNGDSDFHNKHLDEESVDYNASITTQLTTLTQSDGSVSTVSIRNFKLCSCKWGKPRTDTFFDTFDFHVSLKFLAIKGEIGHQPAWRESGLWPYNSPQPPFRDFSSQNYDSLVTRLSRAHTHAYVILITSLFSEFFFDF